MIKVIFFDFDGVIVESIDIKTKVFVKLFENEGKDIVEKVKQYHLNNPGVSRFDKFHYIYSEILKKQLSKTEFQNLCNRFSEFVTNEVVNAPYVKGAKEFLDKFFSKIKFFIVSATPEDELKLIIKRRGIFDKFQAIFGAPMTKSQAVKFAIEHYKINPKDAIYVGDAITDYQAAKENNIKFIARKNQSCNKLEDLPEIIKIEDLTELGNIISNI